MPAKLDAGAIYVSIPYSMSAHLCACGCGEKVVLPLHPQQWSFSYDGRSISISPSVGNTGIPCQSHYWIRNGEVVWSTAITTSQALHGHARDRADLAEGDALAHVVKRRHFKRLFAWFGRRKRR
jgi:hypothetical protein